MQDLQKLIRTIFVSSLLFVSPIASGDPKTETADQFLSEYISEIDDRREVLELRFGSESAEQSLIDAFNANGVEYARRNSNAWGQSIWVSWHHSKDFYFRHANHIRSAMSSAQQRDRQYFTLFRPIDAGMPGWRETDLQISELLQTITRMYADMGSVIDEGQFLNQQLVTRKCGFGENENDRATCEQLSNSAKSNSERRSNLVEQIAEEKRKLQTLSESNHFDRPPFNCIRPERKPDVFAHEDGQIGYVYSNNSRIVDRPRNIMARTVERLVLNDRVLVLEGALGDPTWIRVRTETGAEGYIYGNSLRDSIVEPSPPGSMQPPDRRYTENIGITCKG